MNVSIIIVNYKTPELCKECIASIQTALQSESFTYEIILIDNCSNDGNYLRLESLSSDTTHVFQTDHNGGFGYGNNRGAEKATGDYLFFLNSDTILYPSTLGKMLSYMEENPVAGIMSCLMVDGKNNPLVTAHSFESTKSLFVQTIIKPLVPKKIATLRGNVFMNSITSITECDWVSGAALLIPANLFLQIGGWNERFFMYMEDEELCFRVKQSGRKVFCYPEVGLQHLVGKSGGSAFSAYERYRSKILYFKETSPQSFWWNKYILYIQAWLYMRRLKNKEKKEVLRRLKKIDHE